MTVLLATFVTIKLSGHTHSAGLMLPGLLGIDLLALWVLAMLFATKLLPGKPMLMASGWILGTLVVFMIYHSSYNSYHETRRLFWGLNGEQDHIEEVPFFDQKQKTPVVLCPSHANCYTVFVAQHQYLWIKGQYADSLPLHTVSQASLAAWISTLAHENTFLTIKLVPDSQEDALMHVLTTLAAYPEITYGIEDMSPHELQAVKRLHP
ncbi:MAG: hypothetical protein SF053_02765 [Bacteroidia bacterium]|nr:hypothetical protein [Bacteroidia bacterium]